MSIESVIAAFNLDKFKAITHFNLRHNSLSSDSWEQAIAYASNSKWVKGSADLADCFSIEEKVCISVKTRKCEPQIKKRIASRDFVSHPNYFHFGGKKFSEFDLDNIHTVSGRCSVPGLDEQNSSPNEIGLVCLDRYHAFEKKSLKKFKCDNTLDVVVVHGESSNRKNYLLRVLFFNHTLNKVEDWNDVLFDGPRTKYQGHRSMVLGNDANGPHIGRISNLGRQQTCMLRFYRKTEALGVIETSVPLPERDKFDLDSESKLIQDAELQTQQSTALFLNYGPKT